MSYFTDVEDMFEKHELERAYVPTLLTNEETTFRAILMSEELNEFHTAALEKDLASMADALGDLVYVALGTAVKMGLPFDPIWEIIHTTNLTQKIRGGVNKRGNNNQDLMKLETYVDPKEAIQKLVSFDLPEDVAVILSFTISIRQQDYFMAYSQQKGIIRVYLPMDSDIDVTDIKTGDLIKFRANYYLFDDNLYFVDFV
jgi:predicted HAD superfamily Cof-like phosphohydrolase